MMARQTVKMVQTKFLQTPANVVSTQLYCLDNHIHNIMMMSQWSRNVTKKHILNALIIPSVLKFNFCVMAYWIVWMDQMKGISAVR